MSRWSVVYKRAIQDDGSLLFPERLTHEFLENAKKTMGSYIFANQYQNEVIPDGQQCFQKHWIRYYSELPQPTNTFAFIDPAISESDSADYTGLVVVSVDTAQNWYVRHASRQKINPSKIIELCFEVASRYKPLYIGVEDVAFQRSIVQTTSLKMGIRN